MKKFFIKNLSIICVFFALICLVCVFSYNYISTKIIDNNVGETLLSTVNATSYQISQKIDSEYEEIRKYINELDETISTDDKITILNNSKENYSYLNGIDCGFGEFILNSSNINEFYIEGTSYRERNGAFENQLSSNVVGFANFGRDYLVDTNKVNKFSDKDYILFIYQKVFLYLDASAFFRNILVTNTKSSLSAYYVMTQDGRINFQNEQRYSTVFYDSLRGYGNNESDIKELQSKINNIGDKTILLSDFKIYNEKCFILVNRIGTSNLHENYYLVEAFNVQVTKNQFSNTVVPLVATFVILASFLIISQFLNFFLVNRKNDDIYKMIRKRYNNPIYIIRVNLDGNIHSLNKILIKSLKQVDKYKRISDFNFKDNNDNKNTVLFKQIPLTIVFSEAETVDGKELCIRFTTLKKNGRYLLVGSNATTLEEQNDKYRMMALYDKVTKLPNVEELKIKISELIEALQKEGVQTKSSIAFIDIKNYKNFESLYGKEAIEKILIKTASELKTLISPSMQLFYVAKSTFAVTFSELKEYNEGIEWLEKCEQYFKKPLVLDNVDLILELTFAVYNLDLNNFTETNPNVIVNCLFRTLQKVQSFVTNKIEVYDLAISRFISNEELYEKEVRDAIDKKEFEMFMQPQYNNVDNRICGFEMLLRWLNPKYRNQSPAHLVEIAEKNGLINKIGEFVNDRSMEIAKILEPYDIEISLNVSPVQLMQAGFVKDFIDCANRHNVKYSQIAIEITETFLMENFDIVIQKLKALKKLGFRIHLDDFGTGYSSMLYLKELPIDTIKIDKEFTKNINTDIYSKAIVVKTISLARNLDLNVIAEGVEGEKQNAFLKKNDCNIIQGYLISKAVPLDMGMELIQQYNIDKTKKVDDSSAKKKINK